MDLIEGGINKLSTTGLLAMYKDVVHRIGTHVTGGNSVVEYIRKQERILNLIQDEILRRENQDASKDIISL